jgi:hypothetical protein
LTRHQTPPQRRRVNPRSIKLRERLREIHAVHKQIEEAARQCLALASLYIEREDFDTAHDRLLEANNSTNASTSPAGSKQSAALVDRI